MANTFYTIEAPGIRCTLCDLGASIAGVAVRDRRGALIEVALPCDSFYSERPGRYSAGRTIGPCCGRVKDGEAFIDGRRCALTQNEGRNHLHGGVNGCAGQRWTVQAYDSASVRFALTLPDGLDGYPGNRVLSAEYRVDENALYVVYSATTDAATWLDMTNHVYWDLGGRFDGSAMDQSLELASSKVVFNDASHLPTAIVDVDSAFDFASPCTLSEKLREHSAHPQLINARGFNNAYVLDPDSVRSRGFAARLYSPASGIRMTMTTDQPAIILYSGGYLNDHTRLRLAPGAASPGCAVALEAQGLPDPFHLPGAAAGILNRGEQYRREICWRFDVPPFHTSNASEAVIQS